MPRIPCPGVPAGGGRGFRAEGGRDRRGVPDHGARPIGRIPRRCACHEGGRGDPGQRRPGAVGRVPADPGPWKSWSTVTTWCAACPASTHRGHLRRQWRSVSRSAWSSPKHVSVVSRSCGRHRERADAADVLRVLSPRPEPRPSPRLRPAPCVGSCAARGPGTRREGHHRVDDVQVHMRGIGERGAHALVHVDQRVDQHDVWSQWSRRASPARAWSRGSTCRPGR